MKHLVISDYGVFLGTESHLLVVKNKEKNDIKKFPISRLATISIAKKGVSFSSDLIEQLSFRGIKLFFLNFKKTPHSMLVGCHQHAVVQVRINQYNYIKDKSYILAHRVIIGKIKNQKATLNYFNKHYKSSILELAIREIKISLFKLEKINDINKLLGFEGYVASVYFSALAKQNLFTSSFKKREQRGTREISNIMMNLGYSILSSYILSCITNAGLEPYLGFLHTIRPGKQALVLDLMEEYRSWVVDRAVIKLRLKAEGKISMNDDLKKSVISSVQNNLTKKHLYHGKKLKLEYIIQRQIYKLSGHFSGDKQYKPYTFKW